MGLAALVFRCGHPKVKGWNRCHTCNNANRRARYAENREAELERQQNYYKNTDKPHGTVLRYRKGCRCDLCREAKSLSRSKK